MSYVGDWRYAGTYDLDTRTARPQRLIGGAALTCIAFACTWTLIANLTGPSAGPIDVSGTVFHSAARGDRLAANAPAMRGDKLPLTGAAGLRAAMAHWVQKSYATLFDPHFAMGSLAGSFADRLPMQPGGWSVAAAPQQQPVQSAQQNVPMPRAAPLRIASAHGAFRETQTAAAEPALAPTWTPSRTPGLFERLFGKSSSPTLAYADADTGSLGTPSAVTGRYDRHTAVYDITAHVVYLPDGRKLEAHSGLGQFLDDPHSADIHMRGVTPPTIYDLQPREASFHGVDALRLIPEDESKVYGRSGLLAHSFMLGPNGDSNGCVSFRDYNAFLEAYRDHEIDRLAVVTRLD